MKAPLPGRSNIVLTRDESYDRQGIQIVRSLKEGIELAQAQCEIEGRDELFVIGGAGVYAEALPLATRLYLTQVHADVEGDTYFPEFDLAKWQVRRSEDHPADERNTYSFTMMLLERRAEP